MPHGEEETHYPEMTLCGEQDIKIQELTVDMLNGKAR